MSEPEPVQYKHGDTVWVKLRFCWWPGEVVDYDKLPENVREELQFTKMPLAIVTFFQEDSYEFIKNLNLIFPYNCQKKDDFIKKGLDLHRAKHQFMEKFPADVIAAEKLTHGNENILNDPKYGPQKAKDAYDGIFPSPNKKPKDKLKRLSIGKGSPGRKKAVEPFVTHHRFVGFDDHQFRMLIQSPDKVQEKVDENTYTCQTCGFSANRLGVIMIHNKTHTSSPGGAGKKVKRPPAKKFNKRGPSRIPYSKTSSIDEDIARIEQGLPITIDDFSSPEEEQEEDDDKPKTKRKKTTPKPRKSGKKSKVEVKIAEEKKTDIRVDLLAEWDDEEEEEDENKKDDEDKKGDEDEKKDDKEEEEDKKVEEIINDAEHKSSAIIKPPDEKVNNKETAIVDAPIEESAKSATPPPTWTSSTSDVDNKGAFEVKEAEEKLDTDSVSNLDKRKSAEPTEDPNLPTAEDDANRTIDNETKPQTPTEKHTSDQDSSFNELLESTAIPELPEIPSSLKCEQNFHNTKTIKFPDKVDSPPAAATKLTNPKKRFVKSFEETMEKENGNKKSKLETSTDESNKSIVLSNKSFEDFQFSLLNASISSEPQTPIEEEKPIAVSSTSQEIEKDCASPIDKKLSDKSECKRESRSSKKEPKFKSEVIVEETKKESRTPTRELRRDKKPKETKDSKPKEILEEIKDEVKKTEKVKEEDAKNHSRKSTKEKRQSKLLKEPSKELVVEEKALEEPETVIKEDAVEEKSKDDKNGANAKGKIELTKSGKKKGKTIQSLDEEVKVKRDEVKEKPSTAKDFVKSDLDEEVKTKKKLDFEAALESADTVFSESKRRKKHSESGSKDKVEPEKEKSKKPSKHEPQEDFLSKPSKRLSKGAEVKAKKGNKSELDIFNVEKLSKEESEKPKPKLIDGELEKQGEEDPEKEVLLDAKQFKKTARALRSEHKEIDPIIDTIEPTPNKRKRSGKFDILKDFDVQEPPAKEDAAKPSRSMRSGTKKELVNEATLKVIIGAIKKRDLVNQSISKEVVKDKKKTEEIKKDDVKEDLAGKSDAKIRNLRSKKTEAKDAVQKTEVDVKCDNLESSDEHALVQQDSSKLPEPEVEKIPVVESAEEFLEVSHMAANLKEAPSIVEVTEAPLVESINKEVVATAVVVKEIECIEKEAQIKEDVKAIVEAPVVNVPVETDIKTVDLKINKREKRRDRMSSRLSDERAKKYGAIEEMFKSTDLQGSNSKKETTRVEEKLETVVQKIEVANEEIAIKNEEVKPLATEFKLEESLDAVLAQADDKVKEEKVELKLEEKCELKEEDNNEIVGASCDVKSIFKDDFVDQKDSEVVVEKAENEDDNKQLETNTETIIESSNVQDIKKIDEIIDKAEHFQLDNEIDVKPKKEEEKIIEKLEEEPTNEEKILELKSEGELPKVEEVEEIKQEAPTIKKSKRITSDLNVEQLFETICGSSKSKEKCASKPNQSPKKVIGENIADIRNEVCAESESKPSIVKSLEVSKLKSQLMTKLQEQKKPASRQRTRSEDVVKSREFNDIVGILPPKRNRESAADKATRRLSLQTHDELVAEKAEEAEIVENKIEDIKEKEMEASIESDVKNVIDEVLDRTEGILPTITPVLPPLSSELVPDEKELSIEKNLTVVSASDLGDGQVEIANVPIIEEGTLTATTIVDFTGVEEIRSAPPPTSEMDIERQMEDIVGGSVGFSDPIKKSDSDLNKPKGVTQSKLMEILADVKIEPKEKTKSPIPKMSNPKFDVTPAKPKPKLVVRTSLPSCSKSSNKPTILSEKIIKPASTESSSVSVQKITSKRSFDDFEDIDAYIIKKPAKAAEGTPEVAKKPVPPTKSKPKIINQTIITPAGKVIQPAISKADDNVFDIDNMPIVLSDQLLTPESIENMQIIVQQDQAQVTNKIVKKIVPQTQPQVKILNKTMTTSFRSITPGKTFIKHIKPSQKVYQTSTPTGLKHSPTIISQAGKPGKFVIVPPESSAPTGSKYTVGKRPFIKKSPAILGSPKIQNVATTEPRGNKIMIVTNNQGQQSRVLLTPAQQKKFGYQTPIKKATTVKGIVQKDSSKAPNIISQTIINSKGQITTTNTGMYTSPGTSMSHIRKTKIEPKKILGQKLLLQSQIKGTTGQQRTIIIKNPQGQTVKKIQGTDDALLEQQVAEQIEAINRAAGAKANYKQLAVKRASYPAKKAEPKLTVQTSKQIFLNTSTTKSSIPPLAPISPTKKLETTKILKPSPSMKEVEKTSDAAAQGKDVTDPKRTPHQLVIQDALGNQTTITEGQILALPSETVDGQPQSYMLVTLDETGNLTPLNNEALMSLDPNLGGDLSNMVLQIDQNESTTSGGTPTTTTTVVSTPAPPPPEPVEEPKVEAPTPPVEVAVPATAATAAPTPSTEQTPSMQAVAINNGDSNQQLIITGDPVSTQKFLESLTEGNADLANLLANAEGNILIHADGQQILINNDSDNQMLLALNPDALGGEGNAMFANQTPKNQDILAAALADTDVFQQEQQALVPKVTQSQLSPGSGLYPMSVNNVLETSSMNSPIMTPLEIPSTNSKKVEDKDILSQVPKNVDLPITITDPNISQTVSQQQVALLTSTELELPLAIHDVAAVTSAEMSSPSFGYSLPSLDEKPFTGSISMPLLTEEPEDIAASSLPNEITEKEKAESRLKEEYLLASAGSLCTQMCNSLSEPPPDMFDFSTIEQNFELERKQGDIPVSTGDEFAVDKVNSPGGISTDDSVEIPVQPEIVTNTAGSGSSKRALDEQEEAAEEAEKKKCKVD